MLVGIIASTGAARAQTQVEALGSGESDDAAARNHFVLGRAAYRGADYEAALAHFWQAYELSGRSQLLYNVGISADRLGKNEEALRVFERYLEETESPSREQEVRERIAFLRLAVEERKQRERLAAETAARDDRAAQVPEPRQRKLPRSGIVGASVLGAVGVTGVSLMAVGISQKGVCVETDPSGACVSQRTTSAWTAVYGGIGVAALAGSALWFGIASRRTKRERATTWQLSPTGVTVSGSF